MKKSWINTIILLAVITGILSTPVICHAEEITDKSELIAGEDERASSESVGTEDMVPVYGEDVKDGVYPIEVESSSSMFRIVKAELTVTEGKMTATLTLGGKGYLKLYMGTGEQAVEADEGDYAQFAEDAEGAYTYTVPVEALDKELECTGFSKKKEKWYDHQILFRADTLPEEAVVSKLVPAQINADDGDYTMEVTLTGGSGKASVLSPAEISITGKEATALIRWSSSNYDYMIVNGETYLPVNTDGNSEFAIPVLLLDQEMEVIADTTAMNKPHEITYGLIFHLDSMKKAKDNSTILVTAVCIFLCAAVIAGLLFYIGRKKKKDRYEKN